MSSPAARLRSAFTSDRAAVLAAGCYDALTASLIERAGFEAAYLSGAAIAYTRLGRPDIGLVSAAEVSETIALIRDRVPELPLIVDADTGFGNALNVQRTVRTFERAGASAMQLEDQVMPKRCGHLRGKRLVAAVEMVGKIRAALDARHAAATAIIARTDAIGVEGFEAALVRANLYAQAGADVLFIEAPQSLEQMRVICSTFAHRIPLLANMVEGGTTPLRSAQELGAMGFRVVIFPGALVRALVWTAERFLADLKRTGSSAPWADRMLDLSGLNGVLGTEALLESGRRYDEEIAGAGREPPSSPPCSSQLNRGDVVQLSNQTPRQYYEEIKARPTRAKFGFGAKPALINIDLQRAYTAIDEFTTAYQTDPKQLDYINELADGCRSKGLPVVWTYVAYMESGEDAGVWGTRTNTPDSLQNIKVGSRRSEFDDRLHIDRVRDVIINKRMASAFHESHLQSLLVWHKVDTVIITGGSTSGCVRATAVDSLMRGYRTIVPEECVADKHEIPHFANLCDLLLKYADVEPVTIVRQYISAWRPA